MGKLQRTYWFRESNGVYAAALAGRTVSRRLQPTQRLPKEANIPVALASA